MEHNPHVTRASVAMYHPVASALGRETADKLYPHVSKFLARLERRLAQHGAAVSGRERRLGRGLLRARALVVIAPDLGFQLQELGDPVPGIGGLLAYFLGGIGAKLVTAPRSEVDLSQ